MRSCRSRNLPPFASPCCGARYKEMLVGPQPIQMVLAPTAQAAIDSGKGLGQDDELAEHELV